MTVLEGGRRRQRVSAEQLRAAVALVLGLAVVGALALGLALVGLVWWLLT